jgi:competence protein ComEC
MAIAIAACGGLFWTAFSLQSQMNDRYTDFERGELLRLEGRIIGLPDVMDGYTRFRLKPLPSGYEGPPSLFKGSAAPQELPRRILVNWYRDPPELQPGQVWRLQVQLKPPWGLVNFQGNDRERWLFAEGIGAQATVRQGELLGTARWHGWLDRMRARLSAAIAQTTTSPEGVGPEGVGMVRALAVADRSGLTKQQTQILSVTGTAHLLAISGLHVGLAYILAYGLARFLLMPFGRWLPNSQIGSLLFGWSVAGFYAGLAGFSTATVRALVMLSVILVLVLLRRRIKPMHSLLLALAIVLLTEPLAPLQAGTWMSFVAVGALMLWFVPRHTRWRSWLFKSFQAQLAVMLVSLPFTAWWFQLSSSAGFVANLVAIPWVSFVVVPLVLLAIVVWPISEFAFYGLVRLAAQAADALMWLLGPLSASVQEFSTVLQPSFWNLLPAIVAAVLLLLPRGLRLQAPALLLMLPLLLPASPAAAQRFVMEVLDAGQGTALLLQTGSQLLLYDSGPGSNLEDASGYDLVSSVIHPAVLANGHAAPDRIVISHGDLDHAGGLASLREKYPRVPVFANLRNPLPGVLPCHDTLGWQWSQSRVQALHPSAFLPYLGNDSSCVVEVDAGRFKTLLAGDISSNVEKRLVARGLGVNRILLVPHHGSRSSSSGELLHATLPELAIATAGIGNRFDFPRQEVRQRYSDAGIRFISTDQCGAIRLEAEGDGPLELSSARRVRAAPWRWPAGDECP